MRTTRRAFLRAGAVFGASALAGCTTGRRGTPTSATTSAGRAHARLGVAEYRPYAYRGDDGLTGLTGQVVEIARVAFARLHTDVEVQLVPYTALRPTFASGALDAVGALRRTRTNCAWVAHYVPDHVSNTALAVPAANPMGLATFADVVARNARLAVVADALEVGAARAAGVGDLDVLPNAEVALATLAEGRADCVAYDDITLRHMAAARPRLAVGPSFALPGGAPVYGFGFASEHGALAESFAGVLAGLRDSGEWQRVARPFGFTEHNVLSGEDSEEDTDAEKACE